MFSGQFSPQMMFPFPPPLVRLQVPSPEKLAKVTDVGGLAQSRESVGNSGGGLLPRMRADSGPLGVNRGEIMSDGRNPSPSCSGMSNPGAGGSDDARKHKSKSGRSGSRRPQDQISSDKVDLPQDQRQVPQDQRQVLQNQRQVPKDKRQVPHDQCHVLEEQRQPSAHREDGASTQDENSAKVS